MIYGRITVGTARSKARKLGAKTVDLSEFGVGRFAASFATEEAMRRFQRYCLDRGFPTDTRLSKPPWKRKVRFLVGVCYKDRIKDKSQKNAMKALANIHRHADQMMQVRQRMAESHSPRKVK